MPPEVRSYVETEGLPPGRALDLGCGTGTNAVYLAERGWDAVGVDFSPRAVELARRRASRIPKPPQFAVADVTRLPDFGAPFDLALDIGCLHSLAAEGRARYAASLARALRGGATYLLYAFLPAPGGAGISREEAERLFGHDLTLQRYEEGSGRPSAWYRFVRR